MQSKQMEHVVLLNQWTNSRPWFWVKYD